MWCRVGWCGASRSIVPLQRGIVTFRARTLISGRYSRPSVCVIPKVRSYSDAATALNSERIRAGTSGSVLSKKRQEMLGGLFLSSGAPNFETCITCDHLENTLLRIVGGQSDPVTKDVIHRVCN